MEYGRRGSWQTQRIGGHREKRRSLVAETRRVVSLDVGAREAVSFTHGSSYQTRQRPPFLVSGLQKRTPVPSYGCKPSASLAVERLNGCADVYAVAYGESRHTLSVPHDHHERQDSVLRGLRQCSQGSDRANG